MTILQVGIMTDYFSEYSSFIGAKGLPSPADTPYDTPGFLRSKRSSRVGVESEPSSPPPLPPDTAEFQEKARDGRYTALDPRRFTPTLHASLVSEILNLRRELDSKNNLVENLETTLSTTKTENEGLSEQIAAHAKEVRKAKLQTEALEKGTYEAVEELAKERDLAVKNLDDLRSRLNSVQKNARQQDEDAERAQQIWDSEKERWDNERRQLERRLHVTETRLRTVVEEMTTHQQALEARRIQAEDTDDSTFKDSGLGNESDTGSVHTATPVRHRRNVSSVSFRSRNSRTPTSRTADIPEPHAKPNGYNLADELGIDEEDEYDIDEFEHPDEELEYNERLRKTMESRQSSVAGEDSKAKRILGLTSENVDRPTSPTFRDTQKLSIDSVNFSEPAVRQSLEQPVTLPTVSEVKASPAVRYVDTGYQPSPPPSPPSKEISSKEESVRPQPPVIAVEPANDASSLPNKMSPASAKLGSSPISPPETPVVDVMKWPEDKSFPVSATTYSTASTQTDIVQPEYAKGVHVKRESLSPPSFVPAIAIHPPTSRPSTPKPYVLPPGTKNAFTQASLRWPRRDASVQTEGIRIDKRSYKPQNIAPIALLPTSTTLLPSPTFSEPPAPKPPKRMTGTGTAKIFSKPFAPPSIPSPPYQSPKESSPEISRNNSAKDLRSMPLRAIPLPKPTLAPTGGADEHVSEGPLNRSVQYGVTKPAQLGTKMFDLDKIADLSDTDDIMSDADTRDLDNSIPALNRPPQGRFGLSEPPKAVPEDKEISPERRPDTAGSYGAAPAPSVASSRGTSQHARSKAAGKRGVYKDFRSRSPSFDSMVSSRYSTQSGVPNPPFPIPTRSSSRVLPVSHSEGSQSPTSYYNDIFGTRTNRSTQPQHSRQASLRKVQSAAVMRNGGGRRGSPQRSRRRKRHSPDLTPIHSMAFESPAPQTFAVPDLPTPLQDNASFDYIKGSVDLTNVAPTVATTPRMSEETNLVDAIAGTMVGEWMWKYIRKRKSFGVQEDFPIAEDGTVNISGSRHKRWVWLSPYERTIMWDNKQPATNNALLGKKGRKCKLKFSAMADNLTNFSAVAIQSVLDVQDDTPLPKNPELRSAFHRSILILTPARALKFTTISQDRHELWMTALSFLAQSGRLPSQIPRPPSHAPPVPAVPRLPVPDSVPIKRNRSPSFGRANVRDSIRLAKGKRPFEMPKFPARLDSDPTRAMMALEGGSNNESADFPSVPRLYITTSKHQRKRSNTSPRLPTSLNGFRSFSSSAIPSSASSAGLQAAGSTTSSYFRPSASSKSGSGRNSIRDSMASPIQPNFFEAVGTVRMEAFVDPNVRDGVLYVPAPPSVSNQRRRRGDSNISQTTNDKRRNGYVFDEYDMDPFKNF